MACCAAAPIVAKSIPRQPEDHYFPYTGPGPWYTCKADGEMAPRVSKAGLAGPDVPQTNIPALFKRAVQTKGGKDALLVERPTPPLGKDGKVPEAFPREKWTTWTFEKYHQDARALSKAFIKLGFQQFDTVNIWGFNSPEWFISVMAGMYAGGKCGGLYPTDTAATAAYKVVHSGGIVCTVENKSHIDKIVSALNDGDRKDASRLKAFIAWSYDPAQGETVNVEGCGAVPVISWKAALEMGKAESDDELERRFAGIKPGHCCALIYTSGTTGDPKAVMVSHDGLIYLGNAVMTTVGKSCGFATAATEERVLSYLPLSHVAGLCCDIVAQITTTAMNPAWGTVFFARPYDLKAGTIKDRLLISRPTLFLGVPLVWEKMADRIRAIGAASTGLKKAASTWAKGKCLEHAKALNLGGSGAIPGGHCLAMKLMKAVKGAVGLDQCKYAFTGAAPIRTDTQEYFGSLGIYINEVYGMSESTGVVTISSDTAHQWGSVGWELAGCEVEIFKVDPDDVNKKAQCSLAPALDSSGDEYQGEICFRGRGIMMGYLSCQDWGEQHISSVEKKTAETIDAQGWVHSGDKGLKTKAGMIKITGRYKELIIGEGGENIAPVPIEDSVKGLCDGIGECMMIGDKRKYNVALITLKAVGANGEVPGTDALDAAAKNVNPDVQTISGAMKDQKWIQTITDALTKTNSNGKVVPNNAFKIQKFMILPHNFSEEGGELTPTKKLKRAVAEKKYAKQIEHMYITDGTYVEYVA